MAFLLVPDVDTTDMVADAAINFRIEYQTGE